MPSCPLSAWSWHRRCAGSQGLETWRCYQGVGWSENRLLEYPSTRFYHQVLANIHLGFVWLCSSCVSFKLRIKEVLLLGTKVTRCSEYFEGRWVAVVKWRFTRVVWIRSVYMLIPGFMWNSWSYYMTQDATIWHVVTFKDAGRPIVPSKQALMYLPRFGMNFLSCRCAQHDKP